MRKGIVLATFLITDFGVALLVLVGIFLGVSLGIFVIYLIDKSIDEGTRRG